MTLSWVVAIGVLLSVVVPRISGRPAPRRSAEALLLGLPFLLGLAAGHAPPPSAATAMLAADVTDDPTPPVQLRGRVVSAPRAVATRLHGELPGAPPRVRFEFELYRDAQVESALGSSRRVLVVVAGDPDVARGDELEVTGRFVGDSPCLIVRSPHHVCWLRRAGWASLALGDRVRRGLRQAWAVRFSQPAAGWLAAVFLGERGFLDARTPSRFRRIGQSHLIAISGLHVGILAAAVLLPLRRLRRLSGAATVGVAVLVAGYAVLVGGDPPVLRAAALGLLVALAAGRGRPSHLLHGTTLALLVVGCVVGDGTDRPAFVLSFAAVFAIGWLGAAPERALDPLRSRFGSRLLRSVRVSVAAWTGASAVLVWWTPEVVPAAPLFTLVMVPGIALLLGLGMVASVTPPSALDGGLDLAARAVVTVLEGLAGFFDSLPGTPWTWPPTPPLAITLAILAVALVAHRPRRWRASAGCVALAALAASPPPPPFGVEMLPVGRGQAILAWSPRGVILYDAGSLDREEGGARDIAAALRRIGRSTIDLVVLSHPHLDHVDALRGLVERGCVGRVVLGPRFRANDLGAATVDWLERRRIPRELASAGTTFRVGDWTLRVLHPPSTRSAPVSINDDSVAGVLTARGLTVIVTGDLEARGIAEWALPSGADVVVLPHHGRITLGLEGWLARGRPRRLVASTPARGLPAATRAVVERLGIETLCTAGRGVEIVRQGTGWSVRRRAAP